MKKSAQRDANTVCQKFVPCRRPLARGAGLPKFNQLEMVTTYTYRPSLVKIDAVSSYRGNRHHPPACHKCRLPVANTACHKHTDRQDRLQYTAPLASMQCNNTTSSALHSSSIDDKQFFILIYYSVWSSCCTGH